MSNILFYGRFVEVCSVVGLLAVIQRRCCPNQDVVKSARSLKLAIAAITTNPIITGSVRKTFLIRSNGVPFWPNIVHQMCLSARIWQGILSEHVSFATVVMLVEPLWPNQHVQVHD